MKKFKFKLETVLAERKRFEDMKLKEWTMAKRYLQALVEDLGDLEQALTDAIGKGTELATASGADNVGMFTAIDSFISGQKLRIVWKGQEIERATKLTEKMRALYVQARSRREALEKLRERKLGEFREAVAKREAKQLDDIYIMSGAARRRMDQEEEEVSA